jgi:cardiolipin synthase A/B
MLDSEARSLRLRTGLSLLVVALLAGACASVTRHITLPPLVLGEPSFFPTLEAYSSAPIVGGNRVDILLNGEQSFPAQTEAVRAARRSITMAQYWYEDGLVARDLTQALAERCRAGVKAHILLDSFGSLGMPPEYTETLRQAGCRLVFFRPLNPLDVRVNKRNHRRILVVDGTVGFTGGSGISRKWMGDGRVDGHWRDTDVRVGGPVVQYLQGAFAENWLEATGEVLGGRDYFPRPIPNRGQVYAQVVRSSPAEGSFAMYTTFLLAMSSARHSIYITNPYFLPDRKMVEILEEAVRRGVRIVILVPDSTDSSLVRQASRRHFGRLLKAGIEIYEYRPGLLHAKTMVIDGIWATIGSTNLDNRSFALNDELNLVVYDRDVARRLEGAFHADLARSGKLEYRRWLSRGFFDRVLELLALPLQDNL